MHPAFAFQLGKIAVAEQVVGWECGGIHICIAILLMLTATSVRALSTCIFKQTCARSSCSKSGLEQQACQEMPR